MIRPIALLAIVLYVLVPRVHSQDTNDRKPLRLFDGKSLSDWEYDADRWRVENGAIVGEISQGERLANNTWIIWKGGELTDFDLRLQFKLTGAPAANSGIQIRCQAESPEHVAGYQADLDMGATWLGRIYDEHGRALLVERGQRVLIHPDGKRISQTFAPAGMYGTIFRENDWNDYRIVAIGERISVFVNGTLFSELVDRETNAKDLSGKLAFQLHAGPETRIEFRNILLEKLDAKDDRLGEFKLQDASDNTKQTQQEQGDLPRNASGKELNLDFETGDLTGWKATGDAFNKQPVQQDTIGQRWRGQSSNKHGKFFIGGYEITHSDRPQGTLTSAWFEATHPFASFLIAGGSSPATRVDVLAQSSDGGKEEVIASASGDQREQMRRVVVDLRKQKGRPIAVRLVDESSGGWGHLNFDDFRFHKSRPEFAEATAASPLSNPLLHHLVPNPATDAQALTGDTLAKMFVPEGFTVDLIAAEPQINQPMAFTFDAKGRLWVVEGHSYPTKRPVGEGLDKIVIFADNDHDGTFESRKIFTEGLNLVSGMQVGHGGVWIGAAPELLFIPDRNGDDVPDSEPQVLLDGFGYADTHETINSFIWGPDGWLYANQGVFNQSLVGKPGTSDSQRVRLAAGVWRYHPTRHEFEVFAHGGSNQWGLDFDEHGQLFMTHCRSYWGRGSTTHVIQGGHYWNQTNRRYAPFISRSVVAGIPEMKNYLLASARYGHGEGGAGKRGSRALYGGHAHVGTMIYQGNNWPAELRNHLFTHNLHGHRMNHEINLREGSGFNTVHAGYDVLYCSDPQYIGVDLQCGPDGAVYISDWYDPRLCHSPHTELWQRGNGRMYRMRYEELTPANVNYAEASDLELAEAQLHPNEWHVRMARLVLAERAASRSIDTAAIERLKNMATTHDSDGRRLRALWCLHVIDALDEPLARQLLADNSEYVRAWTIQLLAERDHVQHRDALITSLLKSESSPLVRLYLASAAARLGSGTGWTIIETLAQQPENAADRNLPLMIWYAIGKLIPENLARAEQLIDNTKIPAIARYITWYAPQISDEGRDFLTARVANSSGEQRSELLKLYAAGLQGTRNLKQPAGWASLAKELYNDDATRNAAETLGAAFNDETLYQRMRTQLASQESSLKARQHAFSILANDNNPANLPLLLKSIDTPRLRMPVIRQLKKYNDPRVAAALIERLPKLADAQNDAAMDTLCSRAGWAIQLLDAIREGRVQKDELTGFYVRQMVNLGNKDVESRLREQWGKLGQTTAETRAAIKQLVETYNKAPLWAYNQRAGEGHFKKLCATCHVQGELSQRIGPKLDGTGDKGIDYIVENILDPNAVVGKDFQARTIVTKDGLVITGVILKETDSALTVRTANETETVAKSDIDEMVVSNKSFMPEDILKPLKDRERIELLKYLMSLK
jgi:putative membrane-bound dehydrogenase-like protein